MSKTNDFIETITEKLKHDRELRLDISHELQTHLDEAVEEYKASDYSDDDAIEAAIKDMGDAEQLTDDLWQANKSRMKLRAWCWWIARLTLWPASVLVTLAFFLSGLASNGMFQDWGAAGPNLIMYGENGTKVNRYLLQFMRSGMTEEQKLIAFGDESKMDDPVKRWEVLVDRWPEEPLYQAHYVAQMMVNGLREIPDQKRDELKGALRRGKELEPRNGMYDLVDACLNLPIVKFEDDTTLEASMPNNKTGELEPYHPMRFSESQDEATIALAVEQLQEVIKHDYITMHHLDMLRHRMAQLPPPRSMREYYWRVQTASSILLPGLGPIRQFDRFVCVAAMDQARMGNVKTALQWMDMLDVLQQKLAASSECAIELLVAQSCVYLNQTTRMFIHKIAGNEAAFEASRQQAIKTWRFYEQVWREPVKSPENTEFAKRAGTLLAVTARAIPGYQIDPTPSRMGDYALVDRAILTAILFALVLIAGVMSVVSICRCWMTKDRENAPILIWPGVMRMAQMLGIAVLLPVIIYGMLSRTPLFGRDIGIMHNPLLLFGPMVIGLLIGLMVWGCGLEALRKRAIEIGMTTPSKRSNKHRLLIGIWLVMIGLLLLFVNRAVITPEWIGQMPESTKLVLIIGIFVVYLILSWFVLGLEYARLCGIESAVSHCNWGLICVFAVWILVAGLHGLASWILPSTYKPVLNFLDTLGSLTGILLGVWYVAKPRGRCKLFYVSAIRSMSTVFAIATLFMAVTGGMSLHYLEGHYARMMVKQSPIFLDLEVSHSNAHVLRERLSGSEKTPQQLLPVLAK
ncbi:MAG: permease prefix domain 1-containing protein [Phycisphaeraceae bacterium JB051]